MQISLKWVNEIINIQNINLDYLIEKLTLAGFEVEEIIEVEENGKKVARARQVTVGLTYNGQAEITEGLKAGEALITQGFQDLVDGTAISF